MTAERTLLSGWKFEAAWRRLTPYIGPLLFSVGLLIMTDLFWREVARSRGHAAFAATVSSMQERLVGRLQAHDLLLRGGAGLFASTDFVTRQDWARYVATLRLDEDNVGIQGMGYAQLLRPPDLAGHIGAVRAEGFKDYTVVPTGDRAQYAAIVYLEPFHGRNLRAFGFDMYSEPIRREAMARARDEASVTYSGPVRLVQETESDIQTGVLAYTPIYRAGLEPRTVAERQQALQGWAYMALRVRDMLQAAFGDDLARVQVELLDRAQPGAKPSVLYSSVSGQLDADGWAPIDREFSVHGRTWVLRCVAVPGVWLEIEGGLRWVSLFIVAALGGILLVRTRRQVDSHQLVSDHTSALVSGLADSEERFRQMVEGLQDQAFYLLDAQGVIRSWNSGAERIKGWRPEEIIGQHFSVFFTPEDQQAGLPQQALTTAALNGQCRTEGWRLRKDGSRFQASVLLTALHDAQGRVKGFTKLTRDISEQHRQNERLRLASTVFRSTQQGVVITDPQGHVLAANPAFERITEFTEAELMGEGLNLLSSGRHDRDFYAAMWQSLLSEGAWAGEVWNRRKSGEVHAVWLDISVVRDEAGQIVNHVAIYTDVTRIPQAEAQMARVAHHDALTKLPNRVLLESRLSHSIERARRGRGLCAVLFIDLDEFKPVNDRLGHEAGDELLKGVATRLRLNLRENDTAARLGGDEFVVVLEDLASPEGAEVVAGAIIDRTQKPFPLSSGHVVKVGCSVGIAIFPQDGEDGTTLLRHADAALYAAKAAGRGTWRFFSPHEVVETP